MGLTPAGGGAEAVRGAGGAALVARSNMTPAVENNVKPQV